MKAATGELNLTVITIVAIGVVIGFFTMVLWPNIRNKINNSWNDIGNTNADNKTIKGMIIPQGGFKYTTNGYTISVQ